MHFNDMLLRTRSIGSSVVLAAYGAAAVSVAQYPMQRIFLFGAFIHISVIVISFALRRGMNPGMTEKKEAALNKFISLTAVPLVSLRFLPVIPDKQRQ